MGETIRDKIEELRSAKAQAVAQNSSEKAVLAIQETIEELETRAGCPCHKSNAIPVEEIRGRYSDLQVGVILTHADVVRCIFHGPVISSLQISRAIGST